MDKEGLLVDRGEGLERVEPFVEKPDILDSSDPGGFGKTAFLEEVRVWYASGDGGESGGASRWLAFLAYLAYLRSVRPPPSSEVVALRVLIVVVGFVLVALMLVVVGRPELVDEVLNHWPVP